MYIYIYIVGQNSSTRISERHMTVSMLPYLAVSIRVLSLLVWNSLSTLIVMLVSLLNSQVHFLPRDVVCLFFLPWTELPFLLVLAVSRVEVVTVVLLFAVTVVGSVVLLVEHDVLSVYAE